MPEEPQKKPSDNYYYWLAIRIAADFGATLAIPAILAALLGTYLDERWGTKPWMLISLLVIAFALTALVIRRKATFYADLYDKKNS